MCVKEKEIVGVRRTHITASDRRRFNATGATSRSRWYTAVATPVCITVRPRYLRHMMSRRSTRRFTSRRRHDVARRLLSVGTKPPQLRLKCRVLRFQSTLLSTARRTGCDVTDRRAGYRTVNSVTRHSCRVTSFAVNTRLSWYAPRIFHLPAAPRALMYWRHLSIISPAGHCRAAIDSQ